MNLLTLVFLAGLAAGAALQLWLGWRNMAHVRAHRSHVPEVFRDDVPLAQHQKAADYTLANGRLAAAAVVANGLVLAGLSLGGGLVLLDRAWRDLALTPLATGLGVVISAGLIMAGLRSAFSAYRVFSQIR